MTMEFVTLADENRNREKVEGRRQKLKRGRREDLWLLYMQVLLLPSTFCLLPVKIRHITPMGIFTGRNFY